MKYHFLHKDIENPSLLDQSPNRDGFGKGLVLAGEADPCVVAICADLTESTRIEWFREKFPDRYIEVGVAEQNLATVASGMASVGKIPFITSYATFSPGRNNEQIRTTIALNNQPVKIIGSHSGLSVGPDGATHQALEDVSLMSSLPNMIVIAPCDTLEAQKATIAIAKTDKPAYMRVCRDKSPEFTTEETPFEIGKAQLLVTHSGNDIGIISTGVLTYQAVLASKILEEQGIHADVLHCATIKPLDHEAVLELAKRTNAILTVEEHQIHGGLGSRVAGLLASEYPVIMDFCGVNDQFGQSGTTAELYKHYGLDAEAIVKKAEALLIKKNHQH